MSTIASNIKTQAFVRYLTDSSVLRVSLVDADTGGDFDPTGCLLLFSLALPEASAPAIQKYSPIGGITVANPSLVSLVPADFPGITADTDYVYNLRSLRVSTGEIKTVASGTVKFIAVVSQSTALVVATHTTQPGSLIVSSELFRGDITTLTGGGATALDGVDTLSILTKPFIFKLSLDDDVQEFKLRARTGGDPLPDSGDPRLGISIIYPLDRDAVTNDVLFVKIA